MKREYLSGVLNDADVPADPVKLFIRWFKRAVTQKVPSPDAMALATASPKKVPSVRIVLLKGIEQGKFYFFTHYDSPKGRDLEGNPRAEVVFFWPSLERQIRVSGRVKKLSREESQAYFKTRPRGAQIAAWIPHQSTLIESRRKLEKMNHEIAERFFLKAIPCPPFWGGYCLNPGTFEFWQGRPSRLNDRILYYRRKSGRWSHRRLRP